MNDIILSNEITEAIHSVGDLIKSDPRYAAMEKTGREYTADKEINKLLQEYSALENALAVEFSKEEIDEKATKPLQDRIEEIYKTITEIPAYVAYKEASDDYEEFTKAVYEELEFAVTGHRHDDGCTHDCSTCGGCC